MINYVVVTRYERAVTCGYNEVL